MWILDMSEKETEEKEEEDWLERTRSLENHKEEEEKKEEEFVSDEEVSGGEEKKEEGVSLSPRSLPNTSNTQRRRRVTSDHF